MGNRYEPRAQAGLQVKVSGIDLNGNPFKQSAQAHNVSNRGACLDGIGCLRGPGETLEVEHRGKKARFVVVWVGIPGTPEHNRIGIKNRDQQDIWKLDLPKPEPDSFNLPAAPTGEEPSALEPHENKASVERPVQPDFDWQSDSNDRRRYRRYAIDGSATFQVKDANVRTWGRLSDVSPGGCYVESYVPFPAGTELQMELEFREMRVLIDGIVKVVYPALGMGIEFTRITDEQSRQLELLIAYS